MTAPAMIVMASVTVSWMAPVVAVMAGREPPDHCDRDDDSARDADGDGGGDHE
jgi:hypothetical protein